MMVMYPAPRDRSTPANRMCVHCSGLMMPTAVTGHLQVQRRAEDATHGWASSALEAWTCRVCGVTDLYASNPRALG